MGGPQNFETGQQKTHLTAEAKCRGTTAVLNPLSLSSQYQDEGGVMHLDASLLLSFQ